MLSRRDFLALAGGIVVVAACGSDDDGSELEQQHDCARERRGVHGPLARRALERPVRVRRPRSASRSRSTAKQGYASQGTVAVAFAPSVDGQSA